MSRRALSSAEVASLGLNSGPPWRALAPEEATALGLNDEEPPGLESFGRGALQSATLGFADEGYGAASAIGNVLQGKPAGYTAARDESRAAFKRAEEANPNATTAGGIVGAVGSAFIPGLGELGAAKTLGGAVLGGAALGAAQGLGSSEADLTEGEVGQAALDIGIGGVVGGAAGALGHGISRGVEALRGRAAQGVEKAVADRQAADTLAVDKDIASKLGKYRSGVQSASRDLEVLGREGAALPGEVGERAAAFVDSPQGMAVREQVAGNKLATAPERITEMEALRAEHAAALGGRESEIARRVEQGLANPIKREIAPRAWTLGHRLLPVALAGIGASVGGPEGAAVGTELGAVMALTQGRPGIIIRNALRSPGVRKMLWEFAQSAAESQLLGKFGAMVQRAVQQGGVTGGLALHEALLQQSPEYEDELGKALMESGGAQ